MAGWIIGAVAAFFVAPKGATAIWMLAGWRCPCRRGRVRYDSGFSDYTIRRGRLAPNRRSFWRCRACGAVFEQFGGGWPPARFARLDR